MPYYHVQITTKTDPSKIEVELDVDAEELKLRFLDPYRLGRSIVISGRTVFALTLERIQIFETPHDSDAVNRELRARDEASNTIRLVDDQGRLDPLILSQYGTDVTKRYIAGPPGHAAEPQSQPARESRPATNAREVFVVHGRNAAAREAMFAFLRAIDLVPLEWNVAREDTGKPSPYIGEILQAAFSRVHAVVVLLTPDDEVRLKPQFRTGGDPPHETQLTGQARPNVLFEAGMAMGSQPDRVVLVELGNLRSFTDIAGLHIVRMDGSSQRRQELAQKLRTAGCPVNLNGEDWHTAGEFEGALMLSNSESLEAPTDAEQDRSIEKDPQVSEEVKRLLTRATTGSGAPIIKLRNGNKLKVVIDNEYLCNSNDGREAAKWEQVIQDLLDQGLIEDTIGEGQVFYVTHKGFELADRLRDSL